jgi:hypothetical protein
MEFEDILKTSLPFLAIFFLGALIVITTCARKLEQYENNAVLIDYRDNPAVHTLDTVKTPPNTMKDTSAAAKEMLDKTYRSLRGKDNSPDSFPKLNADLVPDTQDITDDGQFKNKIEQTSYDYTIYNPYKTKDK